MEQNIDARELHEIEQELHTEIIPGTEIMTDVGSHHFVKGGNGVLVPQPSPDPHDPLNWSTKWKTMAIIASTSVSFTQGFGPLALAPALTEYMAAFDCTLDQAIQFTGLSILVLGFSNFIWVPLSTSFGRRGVYIISNLVCLASMIWRARAQTYGSFLGACILNGIGAGPAESIQPAVIADLFFLHDRGLWNTIYWTAYMGSLMVAPIICGPMSAMVGWRSFWWLNVGMVITSLIMVVFMFPETKYHRLHPDEIAAAHIGRADASSASSDEKNGVDHFEEQKLGNVATRDTMPELSNVETAARDPYLGKGYPSKSQWKIFQSNAHPFKSMMNDLILPWKLFLFPIVEFAAFVAS